MHLYHCKDNQIPSTFHGDMTYVLWCHTYVSQIAVLFAPHLLHATSCPDIPTGDTLTSRLIVYCLADCLFQLKPQHCYDAHKALKKHRKKQAASKKVQT